MRITLISLLALLVIYAAVSAQVVVPGDQTANAKPSLVAATTDETAGAWVDVRKCSKVTSYITWATGTVSGGVSYDTTDSTSSAGTVTPAVYGVEVSFSGTAPNQTVVTLADGLMWVRARVSTVIGVGSVSASIFCQ